MTGRFRSGKTSIFMRCTGRTLPPTIATMATRTVMGRRNAKTIGFMRVMTSSGMVRSEGEAGCPSQADPGLGLLTAVGVEGVVDDPLPRQDFLVVLQA